MDLFGEWERGISNWTAEQMVEAISEKFVRMEFIVRAVVNLGGMEAVTLWPPDSWSDGNPGGCSPSLHQSQHGRSQRPARRLPYFSL